MLRIKRGFFKIGFCSFVFLYLILLSFFIILFPSNSYGKDTINLDLLGKWEGGYSFYCAEIIQNKTIEGNPIYAFCGTNKGLLILNITDPKHPEEIGSLDVGDIYDVTLFKSNSNSFNYAALANGANGLVIVDISDITTPFYAGGFDTQGIAYSVVVSENYAYVSDWNKGLIIIDMANPIKPIYTGGYDTQGWAGDVVISENYAYLSDSKKGLIIIDIANPTRPVYTGGCDTPGDAQSVAFSGEYAYVADGENGLVIIEISDPKGPIYRGKYDTQGHVRSVTISGSLAYITDSQKGFVIIDISDPTNPIYAGGYRTEGCPEAVAVFESYACVADWDKGLFIIDISKLKTPACVGHYDTVYACGVGINGEYAYVADGEAGLVIINVSDPNVSSHAGKFNTAGEARGVAVTEDYAYVADGENGLVIVNITNPNSPSLTGWYKTQGEAHGVAVSDDYAYVADGEKGLVIIDITNPGTPSHTGEYNTQGEACGVAVSEDYAYVADGENGLVVIDITDPTSPSYSGKYDPLLGKAENVSILNNYAYVAYSGWGLVIVDISDPTGPTYVGEYDTPDARGIALSEDYAYMADGGNGLMVIDITDPDPRGYAYAGGYNTQGDASGVAISGNYAYMADGENGLVIIDITDTADSALSGRVDTYGLATGIAVSGNYAYLAYGDSGLVIIDISDPNTPIFSGKYDTQDAYRLALSGSYAYVADWEKGLLIIDISNPKGPTYKGEYMTKGNAYAVSVSGNYAYVASGTGGLVVVDVNDPNDPVYAGKYDTGGYAYNITISDNYNYAYLVDWDNGLEILDITTTPTAPAPLGKFTIPGDAQAVAISGNYAYVAYGDIDNGVGGLKIIDISIPTAPSYAGEYQTIFAYDVSISENYIYIADAIKGIVALDISNPTSPVYAGAFDQEIPFSVSVSGNYAYVAHGPYGTKGFSIMKIIDSPLPQGNLTICATGPASGDNPLWPSSERQANFAFSIFRNQHYPPSFIYNLNPKPHQDINGDGIPEPFIVDDVDPTAADMEYTITSWAYNRLNIGPFYLYLTGQGSQDVYRIFPGQTVKASDVNDPNNSLKHYLDYFQEGTNRDVICLLEFSSSGAFGEDLIGSDTAPYSRTIITCTDAGPSFLDQEGQRSFTVRLLNLLQNPGQIDLFEDTGISYYQRVRLLQGVFSQARQAFRTQGYPFNTQPPQMVTAQGPHTLCSISLSEDSFTSALSDPNKIFITDPNQAVILTPTSHYLDGDINLDSNQVHFHSSDESILLITKQGEAYANPNTGYNGAAYILATIIDPNFTQSPNHDPDIPPLGGVTGKIPIQVNIAGRKEKEELPKAVIAAGRCNDPAGYDYLWESTNRMANHAYHTFISRGYSPANIFYLGHDPNQIGVDGPEVDETFHGILEEIFTDPNNPYLNLAGLTDLTIFLIDHGKQNKFIFGPTDEDYLSPIVLNFWLDTIQTKYPDAKITVIIEACHSGCFVGPLTQGAHNRIVIASTQETTAYLAANGWVSFTYFFFNYLKSGASLADAFEASHIDIAALSWGGIQHPILQDNEERKLASGTLLGGSFILSQDQPCIIQVSEFDDPNDPILPHTPIELWARVTDLDGVERVWAVISAAQSNVSFSGSMDDPIVGLPTVDLLYNLAADKYKGAYQGFTYTGPYTILFLAQDAKGMVSYPKTVHLNVEGYNQDKAFLVYGPNFEDYADFAHRVLKERRFPQNDIQKLEIDGLSSALSSIDTNDPLDHLLLYFILPDTSGIDPNDLDIQLDQIQQDTNCSVTILVDSDYSGRFLKPLGGENEKKRIIITGTDPNHPVSGIGHPFSQFFFSSIYHGVDINQAHHSARFALGFFSDQNPLLDDNGNGQAPDYGLDYDGKFAGKVYLGSPFERIIAGPRITVPAVVYINGRETSTSTIWAQAQDPNSSLWALIIPPDEGLCDTVTLAYNSDKERFEADYAEFTKQGVYMVVIFVQGPEGLLDYDTSPYLVLEPDGYEVDDTSGQAKPILVNHIPQTHSFHDPNDKDYVFFYGYENLPYQVKAERGWTDCQVLMEVFDSNMTSIGYPSPYAVGFSAPRNGFYHVRISYTCPILPSFYPSYDLSVTCPSAGYGTSGIYGWVRDSETGQGIIKARICFANGIQQCGQSMDEWWTNEQGYEIGRIEKGFFLINHVLEGEGSLSIQASGYRADEFEITVYPNDMVKTICYLDRDQNVPVYEPTFDPNTIGKHITLIEQHRSNIELLEIALPKGLNLFSYPLDYPNPYYAGQFLTTHDPGWTSHGPEWFLGMRHYHNGANSQETCYFVFPSLWDAGAWAIQCSDADNPGGFLLQSGEAYALYMQKSKILSFPFPPPNQPITLKEGINWVGVPSPPPGYTSYGMLKEIGAPDEILSICGYNPLTGQWENSYWEFGIPGGKNFPILSGQGYLVFMKTEKKNWRPDY